MNDGEQYPPGPTPWDVQHVFDKMWKIRFAAAPDADRPRWMWVDNPRETGRFWMWVFPSLQGANARAPAPTVVLIMFQCLLIM